MTVFFWYASKNDIISVGRAIAYSETRSNVLRSLSQSSKPSTIFSIRGSMLPSFLGVKPDDKSFLTTVWYGGSLKIRLVV